MKVPKNYQIRGARLQNLTQADAYKLIVRGKAKGPGKKTTQSNMKDAQEEIERETGFRPLPATIWNNMTDKTIERKIGDFLWKLMHGRIRRGEYFKHIKNMEDEQFCPCGEIETIDHVLL